MAKDFASIIEGAPQNENIRAALEKSYSIINSHEKIMVSISGGSDSDIILDIVEMVRKPGIEVHYVFFYTGLEYMATKNHIKYLEEKYGVEIERVDAVVPIPKCAKKYGQPFLSKRVSDYIARLQKHDLYAKERTPRSLFRTPFTDRSKSLPLAYRSAGSFLA